MTEIWGDGDATARERLRSLSNEALWEEVKRLSLTDDPQRKQRERLLEKELHSRGRGLTPSSHLRFGGPFLMYLRKSPDQVTRTLTPFGTSKRDDLP